MLSEQEICLERSATVYDCTIRREAAAAVTMAQQSRGYVTQCQVHRAQINSFDLEYNFIEFYMRIWNIISMKSLRQLIDRID